MPQASALRTCSWSCWVRTFAGGPGDDVAVIADCVPLTCDQAPGSRRILTELRARWRRRTSHGMTVFRGRTRPTGPKSSQGTTVVTPCLEPDLHHFRSPNSRQRIEDPHPPSARLTTEMRP